MVDQRQASAKKIAARWRGISAEVLVAELLVEEGWSILARNWRGGGAELDIVASKDDSIRFVEVKSREHLDQMAFESVGRLKQRKLTMGAEAFLTKSVRQYDEHKFLVVFVTGPVDSPAITWIDDAFEGVF